MTVLRWERLQEIFHQALPLDPTSCAVLLDRECDGDSGLRAEVERLLAAHRRLDGLIDQPAIAAAGVLEADRAPSDLGRKVGAYRLVRELGRGGMGAVYLAERDDGAFVQQVAIKLIKRGMDTDRVMARFRAERQILASLDHPNIARLLDGGTTDDGRPYLAMEYIEGQPLDSFAGDRALNVEERLGLFLQVCDAVAYAHARGVVHRDIKPLNTLVTAAGVPKLLDFGVAKVLEGSGSEDTSTITGLRLLTPDYASPEQVEGRRATVASDVYSLGVVLYELLTGSSPYRLTSRTPQDVAAAVCTTEPDRPSTMVTQAGASTVRRRRAQTPSGPTASVAGARQLSRRLRGDLDTIVLTALRKEPERRYNSVASLADDLRRHLDGRPVLARAEGPSYRLGKFVRRNRSAVLTCFLALLALSLAGWIALRQPAAPTLLEGNVLAPRDRVLVIDLVDRTGDTALAAAITEALRTDLSQSSVVRVLTPRQLRASLELMQQSPDIVLNDSLARELALREGVKAFVSGSLSRVSGSYTINLQLVAAQDGEALAAVRETAADSTGLIAAVDRVSRNLRRRIGGSLRDLESVPPLDRVTTASLPALRLYTEGQRLVEQGERQAAIDRYQQAVAIDTGFAAAYLALAFVHGSNSDMGRSHAAGNRAMAHLARLPLLARGFLLGSRAYSQEDYATAIRVYTELLKRYPDDVPALNNVALAYQGNRQYAVAESLFRRASEIDSTIPGLYFGIHTTQVLRGDFSGSRQTLATVARRFPHNPLLTLVEMHDAAAQQDWTRATQIAWSRVEQAGTDSYQLVDPYEALAGIASTRGRLQEAERLWRQQLALSRAAGLMGRHLFGMLQLALLELRYRYDTTRAIAIVDSALRVTPLDSVLAGDRPYDDLVRFYLAAGQTGRVRPLLAAAAVNDSTLGRVAGSDRRWTLGVLASVEGRRTEALELLAAAAKTNFCPICVLPDLGRAFEVVGRSREARDTYHRYVTTPWLGRYAPDAVELGWTLQRLIELSRQLGDETGASWAAKQLAALWRDADDGLRP